LVKYHDSYLFISVLARYALKKARTVTVRCFIILSIYLSSVLKK